MLLLVYLALLSVLLYVWCGGVDSGETEVERAEERSENVEENRPICTREEAAESARRRRIVMEERRGALDERMRRGARRLRQMFARRRRAGVSAVVGDAVDEREEDEADDTIGARLARLAVRARVLGSEGDEFAKILDGLNAERLAAHVRWTAALDAVTSQLEGIGERKMCVIDLEAINAGDRVVRLPCFHEFHADCLLPYLSQCTVPACPIDRVKVPRHVVRRLPVWTVK